MGKQELNGFFMLGTKKRVIHMVSFFLHVFENLHFFYVH